MLESPLMYFTDAVLRGPTIGSMLMCLAAALVGVVYSCARNPSSEILSHAAYPEVILGVGTLGLFNGDDVAYFTVTISIMTGAFITAILGLWLIRFLKST